MLGRSVRFSMRPPPILLLVVVLPLFATGCGDDDEIRRYSVPKERVREPAAAMPKGLGDAILEATSAPASGGELGYRVPEGWKELPATGMRTAAFEVTAGEKRAEVTVIVLGREAGSVAANVNRWREQVGLSPLSEPEIAASLQEVRVGGEAGRLVHLEGREKVAMLAALVNRADRVWFFKMMGPADLVGAQKENFTKFLESIGF